MRGRVSVCLVCLLLQDEEEAKEKRFEWQRNDRAPRREECVRPNLCAHCAPVLVSGVCWSMHSMHRPAKGSGEMTEQPFGVEVRKVRCLKCGNWGHVNTDSIVSQD